MKKTVRIIICTFVLLLQLSPLAAFAKEEKTVEAPMLTSISFNNAVVESEFSSTTLVYGITLQDADVTPTIKSYEISKDANIFVTYSLDEAKHQTGIIVDVKNEFITTSYCFNYLNARQYKISSNNNLAEVVCEFGEVYPEIDDSSTEYSLYIPSDLTKINLSAATQDVSAYCEIPGTITLNADQEPTIKISVTASDATTKIYTFQVKRLDKTIQQVREEMAKPDFKSLVEGELFYHKPIFFISLISTAAGLLIVIILVVLLKRLALKAEDADEKEFFDIVK